MDALKGGWDMVQAKDLLDKNFNYEMDLGGPIPGQVLDRGIANGSSRVVTTHLRNDPGGQSLATWNFKYLIYRPGAITRTQHTQPVLTGPMSGCLLATYTKNGQPMAAHIGTATSPIDPLTVQVKQAWTTYMGAGGVANVKVGNPFELFTDDDFAPHRTFSGIPMVFGYLTQGFCYALMIRVLRQGGVLSNRIEKVRGMNMRPWANHPDAW